AGLHASVHPGWGEGARAEPLAARHLAAAQALGAFLIADREETAHGLAVRQADQRTHFGLRRRRRPDADRPRALDEALDEAFEERPLDEHAAARAAVLTG